MKFNVYIKVLSTFFVIFLTFVLVFYYYLKSFENEIVFNAGKTTSQGILSGLEKKLRDNSKSKWAVILKKEMNNEISFESIRHLKLNSNQKKKLNKGEIIFSTGANYLFLNLGMVQHTAYKRIGNTSYALAYDFSDPANVFLQYMNPALKQIVKQLRSKSKTSWNEEIAKLEKTYGFPLKVYQTKSRQLPDDIIHSLSKNRLAFETNPGSSQVTTLYYTFKGGIIKIGPLSYLPITARISDVIYYFILAFFVFAFLVISVFSLFFMRNMKKVYQITKNVSHGHFEFQQKIPPTSVLYGLYKNIIHMGERLKELIGSHKQMCRFIAHEIRTPLSTIQMATDSIKRKNADDVFLNQQVNSIQEDITDINRIVSIFLMYSKMHSSELKLKHAETDIILWLRKILEPYYSSKFEITFHANELKFLKADIDETILKHAVSNLMTNAMKFAEHHISISISLQDSHILIHVDDDGPGLPSDSVNDIFSEYAVAEGADIGEKHIGLGLAIVKKVVTLHAGKVIATQSPFLKGARFTIALPQLGLK